MKKTWKKLLITALSLAMLITCALGLVACSSNTWNNSSVISFYGSASFGDAVASENGGFVAETDNYYYFINGIGVDSSSNAMGTPVKGSLVAVDKTDLSKSCVVVPKLFVAKDYASGLFIDGDYVYYGTPSTDKNSSGAIAYTDMVFARTKLDGSDTTTYFKVNSLSVEYRFVTDAQGTVYLTYYTDSELVCFNTATQEKLVIAKTDTEAKSESLSDVLFTSQNAVFYTVDVYESDYIEGVDRTPASSYNKLYCFSAGMTKADDVESAGTLLVDGNANVNAPVKTTLNFARSVKNIDLVFVTQNQNTIDKKALFQVDGSTVGNKEVIANSDYASENALIVDYADNGYAYIKETDGNKLVKVYKDDATHIHDEYVAIAETFGKLLFKNGDYVYYINSSNNLARIRVENVPANDKALYEQETMEQRVSENTISTSWYSPELVGDKVFYVDDSEFGKSYVKYIDLNEVEIKTDLDDDNNITLCYLADKTDASCVNEFVGKILTEDKVDMAESVIAKLSGVTVTYDKDDDGNVILDGTTNLPTFTEIEEKLAEVKDAYNSLGDDKSSVESSSLEKIENLEYALDLAKIMVKLYEFDNLETADKDALRNEYNTVKSALNELKNSSKYTESTILGLLSNETNLNFYFQEAADYFEPAEEE